MAGGVAAKIENEQDIDDLDLDIDPEEEIRRLSALMDKEDGDEEGESEGEEEGESEGEEEGESEGEEEGESEGEEEGEEEPKSEGEEEGEEEPKSEVTADHTPAEAVDETKKVLAELRAEKERLQKQLTELEVRAKISDERFEKLEKSKQEPPKEEEKAPTPEEILEYVDGQISAVEDQLTKAEAEDPSAAPQLRRQLRQLERYYIDIKQQAAQMQEQQVDPTELVNQAVTEAQYKSKFDNTSAVIKQEYPVLNSASDAFNEQLKNDIMEIYQPMLEKGKDPIESLTKATVLVMRANGILSVSEQAQLEQKKAAEAPKMAKPKAKTEERKKEAVKRNVKAAQDQPPNIANAGAPNDSGKKYDFDKMSDKEFDKLIPDEDAEKAFEKALMMYDE